VDDTVRNIVYLVAAVLFIFGIKGLTHPRSAVRGNLLGSLGMLLAIVVTLVDQNIIGWMWIWTGLIIGAAAGVLLATFVQMTAMPQLVGLFNGFGGGASFLVAGAAMHETWSNYRSAVEQQAADAANAVAGAADVFTMPELIAVAASGLIGAVTFSGSMIAFGKLQEYNFMDRLVLPAQTLINAALFLGALALCVWLVMSGGATSAYWLIVLVSLGLGVFLVSRIGGADMPVVISLLNSYSGLAAAATGFVLANTVLIVAGSLVGASGLILTHIMCVAMNRSLPNVLFGVMAEAEAGATADEVYEGKIKSTTPDEAAMLFDTASRVVIVPGYGMAVAQAQHAIRDLMNVLEERGVDVQFGIHPVAGRMPGHMNVLLAEADVPYDKLKEMDEINSSLEQADIALVLGANDVVNPDARTNPDSPIAGMPIINVDKAKTAIVVKRSLSPGFAGIPNPLFAADNCLMMFGDGKKAILELVTALKEG